jgi:hypothetical protein
MDRDYIHETRGDWTEYDYHEVRRAIHDVADNPDLQPAREYAKTTRIVFEDSREEIVFLLTTALQEREDPFIIKLKQQVEEAKAYRAADFIRRFCPSGHLISRDSEAVIQGLQTPPHYAELADAPADLLHRQIRLDEQPACLRHSALGDPLVHRSP